MNSRKIKIYIVDDHQMIIDAIIPKLKEYPDEFLVTGTAANGHGVIEYLKLHSVDVVILDISMPEMGGLETLKIIKSEYPRVKVLILTMYDDLKHITEMVQNGASGYILKNRGSQLVVEAVTDIFNGKDYFPKEIGDVAINALKNGGDLYYKSDKKVINQIITPSEAELLKLLTLDLNGYQIADRTHVQYKTVESRKKNLRQKLGIDSDKGLVRFAMENGFIYPLE